MLRVVLNMNLSKNFAGTNYEYDLNEAMKDIMEQIDGLLFNGSG